MKYATASTECNLGLDFQEQQHVVFCSIEDACSQLYHTYFTVAKVRLLLLIIANNIYFAFPQCRAVN
jgi:hypothetical protein